MIEVPLALGGIHREFELDVIGALVKHNATMHGCPVWKVESKMTGDLAIWFKGQRDGVEWSGALRWNYPLLRDKKWLGDVNACVETTLQLLDNIGRQKGPFIQRAAQG